MTGTIIIMVASVLAFLWAIKELDYYAGLPKPKYKVNDVVVVSDVDALRNNTFGIIERVDVSYAKKWKDVSYSIRFPDGCTSVIREGSISCLANMNCWDTYGDKGR
jgi:hypothetical protein